MGKLKSVVAEGDYKVDEPIAVWVDEKGDEHNLTMCMKWPVKVEVKNYVNKPRPFKILETGIRTIDTMNPMTEGGTGFIPGPFGCGKTVLQHAISKHADADLIIVVACGERANEVVEIFTEFPELDDPRTGRKLIERTIIICNTSNMPVAAREASVYTGMTIAEYYRMMGMKVLLLADSTSRWAQALREMSNRMEELPGPDAFPMDLPAIISNFYSRSGFVELSNGESGSITFIGTVSPAGGNLKEPVTESTKKAARAFYALAHDDWQKYNIRDVVFLGGAADVDSDGWEPFVNSYGGFLYNVYSKKDKVLLASPDFRARVGRNRIEFDSFKIINRHYSSFNHTDYWQRLDYILPRLWKDYRTGS